MWLRLSVSFGQRRYLSHRLLLLNRCWHNWTPRHPLPFNLFLAHRRTSLPPTQRALRPLKRLPHIRRTHPPLTTTTYHLWQPHPTSPSHTFPKIKPGEIPREALDDLRRLRTLTLLLVLLLLANLHAKTAPPRRVKRQRIALGLHVADHGRLPDVLAGGRGGAGEGLGARGGVDVA